MLDAREDIKQYLDQCIEYWRKVKFEEPDGDHPYAYYYIDAYQSMRVSIFGEELEDDRDS
jgi:hypothetical protein